MDTTNKKYFAASELTFTWSELRPGLYLMSAWAPGSMAPVGYLTFTINGPGTCKVTRAEIMSSFVPEWARRHGVRTRMQRELYTGWGVDVVVTQNGTEDGTAWMEARGYKIDKVVGVWVQTRKAAEAID